MSQNLLPFPDAGYVLDHTLFCEVPGSTKMFGGRFVFWCETVHFAADGTARMEYEVGQLVMTTAPEHLQPSWWKQAQTPTISVCEVREIVSERLARAVMITPLLSYN